MEVINFAGLNKAILIIESGISDLNIVERQLVLQQCTFRLKNEVQKNKESDVMARAVDKLPFGKLMSRAMKSQGEQEEK